MKNKFFIDKHMKLRIIENIVGYELTLIRNLNTLLSMLNKKDYFAEIKFTLNNYMYLSNV